jgi:hypothetical protein
MESRGPVTTQLVDEYVTFVFQAAGVKLPQLGEYAIEFGLDETVKNVGRLVIRLPNTAA